MKLFSLDETSSESVSHDPRLKKKVLSRRQLPYIRHISHIILQPGDSVLEHSHADDVEALYCIRGDAEFIIRGERISIKKGHLVFIEPGEAHSITRVNEETELLYFRTPSSP
jgi:quercetin dioxygenase-like cupin family protein